MKTMLESCMERTVTAVLAAMLAACSATKLPERFHTLLPSERATPVAVAAPIYVDVLPVKVPEQVDHTQWVVRQPDDSLLMLEQDRWAAPLQDELRSAVVERLGSQWGAVDVRSVALPTPSVWRIRVDVQRFESIPSREARIESTWSVSTTQGSGVTLVCRSVLREEVSGAGIVPLAAAHRKAVARLADEIGQHLKIMQAGRPANCG
jgi:uncharacterized lipoprotein YmbA